MKLLWHHPEAVQRLKALGTCPGSSETAVSCRRRCRRSFGADGEWAGRDRHDRWSGSARPRAPVASPASWVLSPEGNILAIIPTPESPANVEFGGEDRKTLYIMAGKSLYRIRTTMTGFHIWPPRR